MSNNMNPVRRLVFYFVTFLLVVFVVELLGGLMMVYLDKRSDPWLPSYKKIRLLLRDKADSENLPMFLPQPNLNYVNYPGLTKHGVQINNSHGYRGKESSVIKPNRVLRILFLGGSTTYGMFIDDYKKTYPYLVKIKLDSLFSENPAFRQKYDSIECINAGLLGAISTEELTHYIFKFRYYKPDIVVIKPGLNEEEYIQGIYQPDYTHLRNTDFYIKPLPKRIRWLLCSRFVSAVIINFFYIDYLNYGYILEKKGNPYAKYCSWFPAINVDSLNKTADYRFTAFYQNINMLVQLIHSDSAVAVLATSPLNKKYHPENQNSWKAMLENNNLNNSLISQIALKNQCPLVQLAYPDIPEQCWIDDCHVNETGNSKIAVKTANTLMQAIDEILLCNSNREKLPARK